MGDTPSPKSSHPRHIIPLERGSTQEDQVARVSSWVYRLPIRVGDSVIVSIPPEEAAMEACCLVVLFRRFQECISVYTERDGQRYQVYCPPLDRGREKSQ
jgi:hypothetical protein